MRLKTFTAPTMPAALKMIKAELGANAVVLHTKKITGEDGQPTLQITAAVDGATTPPPAASPTPSKPASTPHLKADDLAGLLAHHGVTEDVTNRVLKAADALADSGFTPSDTLQMVLGKMLTFRQPAALYPKGQAHAFIGPTGAGKTTTIARLAVAAKKRGESVGLISLDTTKLGGFEPLAILADILEDQAHLVGDAEDLKTAAKALGKRNYVFIDTPGLSPYDAAGIKTLSKQLSTLGLKPQLHLVLPITHNSVELPLLPLAFEPLNPQSLIFTKLDETRRWGSIVNAAVSSGLPLCYATDSTSPSTAPAVLDVATLAAKLLTMPTLPWEPAA